MQALHEKYQEKGLRVLGVSLDRVGMAEIKKYVERLSITFPNVLDSKSTTAMPYNIRGVPTTFIIDHQGKTKGIVFGLRQWMSEDGQNLVESLLKESKDN